MRLCSRMAWNQGASVQRQGAAARHSCAPDYRDAPVLERLVKAPSSTQTSFFLRLTSAAMCQFEIEPIRVARLALAPVFSDSATHCT